MNEFAMKKQRLEAARRRRRMIFNNDGSCWDYARKPDPQEFLSVTTTGLADSHVDAIFYSTTETFNWYTHRTKVGEQFNDANNILDGLRAQGTDSLQVMIDFCRKHDKELFWSFRVNDEHDAWVASSGAQWKRDHQHCLFGTRDNSPPNGSWSCVDYTQAEVRDLIFRTIEEVCQNYDIDGIELDFFRQLQCFKKLAWGQPLGDSERQIMNDHLRTIRVMMEQVGQQRGRPLLFAVRVPDCPDFAREMGLDVRHWLEHDLIDIMVVGSYFWLRPWHKSVELGRQYNVPVYPSLDGSRMTDDETRLIRRSDLGYRAAASTAWHQGVDGIYVFNFNYFRNPFQSVWRELGDPNALKELDKIYHVSVMGDGHPDIESYLPDGRRFSQLPRLCPDHPLHMLGGQAYVTTLTVGDDLSAADREFVPKVTLNVKVTELANRDLIMVKLNGSELSAGPLTWQFAIPDDWLEFVVDPKIIQCGDNRIELHLSGQSNAEETCIVHEVQLRLEHGPNARRRRDLTMGQNQHLAFYRSLA